jgi:hypothetical protein
VRRQRRPGPRRHAIGSTNAKRAAGSLIFSRVLCGKNQHAKAKRALPELWMAETRRDALAAFDAFVETWGIKYD